MTIQEMLAERKRLIEEAEAIQATADGEDNRDLTEDEEAKIAANLEAAKDLETKIEAARATQNRQAALRSQLDSANSWADQPQPQQTRVPQLQGNGGGRPNIIGGEASDQFADFGEWLFKVREAAQGHQDPRLTNPALFPSAAAPGMLTTVDSEGGFLIPDEQREGLMEKVHNGGEIIKRCQTVPMTKNTLKVPYINETSRVDGSRWGGVRFYWVEEAGALTDTKPKFGQCSLNVKKGACLGYVTEEMTEDYGASAVLLERLFVDETIFGVEAGIVRGDGAGKPLGIMNANCKVEVSKATNQTATTLWGKNIVNMWSRMPDANRKRAVWLCNQDTETEMWGLTIEGRYGSASTDAGPIPIHYPAGTEMNKGNYSILMGRPVLPVEFCSTLGTAGDVILVDFLDYLLGWKGGPKVASSIHVRFLTDERTYRVTIRVDGQPWWSSAMTPYQGTNTLSPIVTLADRS